MKKFLILAALSLTLFSGCKQAHENGRLFDSLIFKLERTTQLEEAAFRGFYYHDGSQPAEVVVGMVHDLEKAIDKLDTMLLEEGLGPEQQFIIEEYRENYRDYLFNYFERFQRASDRIVEGDFDQAEMDEINAELEEHSPDFVKKHHDFANLVLSYYGMEFVPF